METLGRLSNGAALSYLTAVIARFVAAHYQGMAYVEPTADDLKQRYPAFAAVADATVEYWLTDARLIVTSDWIENDRANAEMALAAHNMARQGLGSGSIGGGGDMAGVTSFRSASFSVQFDSATVKAAATGGYGSTIYGQDFAVYLRRNRGGPFLAGCAHVC